MRHKGGKTTLMMSGKPINRETAITCTGSTNMLFVNIRLFCHIVYCRKIVLHVLAAIIT